MTVYVTVCPGTAVAVLAVLTIVSAGVRTATVTWQGELVVPGGQVDPTADEATVLTRSLPPVSGLLTVTE